MKINVLVVEDDPSMRVVLKSIVRSSAMDLPIGEIFEAENGEEGIQVLEREEVGLMLVDIYMPVMDGLEMLDYVYEHPEYKDIPAIVVSTENDEDRVDAILRKGFGFVHKTLTHKLLKEKLIKFSAKKGTQTD